MVDTSDEWIVERTGIRERRIAGPEQSVAMLSREASEVALQRAGVSAEEIDSIVVATATPDRLLPSTACDLQALLGAHHAAAFDVSAACPGFIYAITVAEGLVASGQSRTVLVVGAEKLSTITDFQDRSTAILFGDGAGASVVRRSSAPGRGLLSTSSSPTDAWRRCSIGPAAAPPIRSARRWCASGPTSSRWPAARCSSPRCWPWRKPATTPSPGPA